MEKSRQLLQNALFIPSEDVYLKSTHVHDYVSHTCKTGHTIAVDGGREYLRRGYGGPPNNRPATIDYSLYEDDSFLRISGALLWGTYGKDGKGPLRQVLLKDCELGHLIAIRDTQSAIKGGIYEKVVLHWINVKEIALRS